MAPRLRRRSLSTLARGGLCSTFGLWGLVLSGVLLLSGCEDGTQQRSDDDDDSGDGGASGDDDDSGDGGASGDDDTTPDPEDPFPGDSIHMGHYTGISHMAGVGADEGVDLCFGTTDTVVDAEGDFTGSGSCEWIDGSQGDGGQPTVSFTYSGRITDVGNMHDATIQHSYSWAPNESNDYVLDGSVSQGRLEFVWWGWMPMPDGEREFTADANGDSVP